MKCLHCENLMESYDDEGSFGNNGNFAFTDYICPYCFSGCHHQQRPKEGLKHYTPHEFRYMKDFPRAVAHLIRYKNYVLAKKMKGADDER